MTVPCLITEMAICFRIADTGKPATGAQYQCIEGKNR
jgi:hypothetical protein